MQQGEIAITYLYHSGFLAETQNHMLVFDYYMDRCEGKRGIEKGVLSARDFVGRQGVRIFASHAHNDHFNPVIFKWREATDDIDYILSDDIHFREQAVRLGPNQDYQEPGMKVHTFGSTDAGVSFLVTTDGLSIFHAGDYNLWHWKSESTKQEVLQAKKAYLDILQTIKGHKIDIAFFPVDPRMGPGYHAGAAHFARQIRPKLLVPMHFGERLEVVSEFQQSTQVEGTRIAGIDGRGSQIDYSAASA